MKNDKYLLGKVVHIIYYDKDVENTDEFYGPAESETWGLIGAEDEETFTIYHWYFLSGDLEDEDSADYITIDKNSIINMEYFDKPKTVKKYSSRTIH